MADEKKRYNNYKERGSPGKREEMVLRKNHRRLVEKLEASDEFIDQLLEDGIFDSGEYRDILNTRAVRLIMAAVLDSGPDGFDKFMDALRKADYNDLAAELEQELENTVVVDDDDGGDGGGGGFKDIALITSIILEVLKKNGLLAPSLLERTLQYSKEKFNKLWSWFISLLEQGKIQLKTISNSSLSTLGLNTKQVVSA